MQDFTCALATGISYVTPRSRRAVDDERRQAARPSPRSAPPSARAARRSDRRAGGGWSCRRRARRCVPPGRHSQPGSRRIERPGIAHVDRPAGLGCVAQSAAADDHGAVRTLLGDGPDRAHRLERRVGVFGAKVVGDAHRLLAHRAEQRRAMRDRLVGRREDLAPQADGPTGMNRRDVIASTSPAVRRRRRAEQWRDVIARTSPAVRRATTAELMARCPDAASYPSSASSPVARAATSAPIHRAIRPVAVVGRGRERHVGDVDAGATERKCGSARRRPAC